MTSDFFDDDEAEEGVYFQYCGYFSQAVIEQTVGRLQEKTDAGDVDPRIGRRLINAFIEVSQNIVHYSHDALTGPETTEGEIRFGSIEITEVGGGFAISSSNPVSEDAAQQLHERLSQLVTLDQDALKERYQAALRADGGIGFLRLARGSSTQLQFSFVDAPINPDIKIFNLMVTVS
jgi:hypothetical protein